MQVADVTEINARGNRILTNDKNISPKIAPSVYAIMNQMKDMGLTQDDLITLIQRRAKVSRTDVQLTLTALETIELNFKRAQKRKKE